MYVHLDARYRQNRTGLLTRVTNHVPVGFYTSVKPVAISKQTNVKEMLQARALAEPKYHGSLKIYSSLILVLLYNLE